MSNQSQILLALKCTDNLLVLYVIVSLAADRVTSDLSDAYKPMVSSRLEMTKLTCMIVLN